MFFLHELERTITLHPSFLGPNVHEYIEDRLKQDVEGIQIENYYIICVMDSQDKSEGRVLPGTGYIEYNVHFKAIVWRPFKGEIVSCGLVLDLQAALTRTSSLTASCPRSSTLASS